MIAQAHRTHQAPAHQDSKLPSLTLHGHDSKFLSAIPEISDELIDLDEIAENPLRKFPNSEVYIKGAFSNTFPNLKKTIEILEWNFCGLTTYLREVISLMENRCTLMKLNSGLDIIVPIEFNVLTLLRSHDSYEEIIKFVKDLRSKIIRFANQEVREFQIERTCCKTCKVWHPAVLVDGTYRYHCSAPAPDLTPISYSDPIPVEVPFTGFAHARKKYCPGCGYLTSYKDLKTDLYTCTRH